MKQTAANFLLRMVLPPLLGAAGAVAATLYPTYYAAVCNGVRFPHVGG